MKISKGGERSVVVRKTPSYQRIATDLRFKVASGQMAPGVMLPGRRDLAAEYGVSVPTIERAVADLLAEGTLRADLRRGTFVGQTAAANPSQGLLGDVPPADRADGVLPASQPQQEIVPHRSIVPATPRLAPGRSLTRSGAKSVSIGIMSRLPFVSSEAEIMAHYSYTIISAIERAVTRSGGRSHFHNLWVPPNDRRPPIEGYEALVQEDVDVILLVNVFQANYFPSLFRAVETMRTPLIVVNEDRVSPPFFSVYYDHADAAYQAARHLYDEGCSELVFFSARSALWVDGRWEGTRKAAHDAERDPESVLERIDRSVTETENAVYDVYHGGYDYARTLLAAEGPALLDGRRGVIAANDQMAAGFMKAAAELGYVVRRDYVIIGFDDQPEARQLSLSTMRPPHEEIGREAVRLAIQVVEEAPSARRVCLHSQLVARSSSRFESTSRA